MKREPRGYFGLIWSAIPGGLVLLVLLALFLQVNIPEWAEITKQGYLFFTERQLGLSPQKTDEMVKTGWVYYQLGRYSKAKETMEKVLRDRTDISALYCLGLIDLKTENYEAGISKLEIVKQESPFHLPTIMALGQAYFSRGEMEKATKCFARILEIQPENPEARRWLEKIRG